MGLLASRTFYLNDGCLQGCCSYSCKGETLRIRNESNLAVRTHGDPSLLLSVGGRVSKRGLILSMN